MKRVSHEATLHCLLTVVLVCAACARPDAPGKQTSPDSTVPGKTAVAPPGCGIDSSAVLGDEGIGQFRVGAPVEEIRAACTVVRDTSIAMGNEGMPERRLAVLINQDNVEATVHQDTIWRIEVQTARLRTADSLGVGTPVQRLRELSAEFLGYGEVGPFVKVKTHCGMSFQLSSFPGHARTLAEVPDAASVVRVLIIGCRNP